MELERAECGSAYRVLAVNVPHAQAMRLRALNVAAGRRVTPLRRAPFGGGILLDAEGVRLAVRPSLARRIEAAPWRQGMAPPAADICAAAQTAPPAAELPAQTYVRAGREARILLVGNPNCGKTTLYNALTGRHARTGNWHGVTVGVYGSAARLAGVRAAVYDLPGIYSLEPYSLEEKIARREILSGEYDLTVCVADALHLPRSLPLLAAVLARGRRAVLVVTMCDLLQKRGGRLDAAALARRLGIPVLAVSAHSRADTARLKTCLAEQLGAGAPPRLPPAAGEWLAGIYDAGARREGRAERLLYSRRFALPLFALLFAAVFYFAFGAWMPGTLCKALIERAASAAGERLASAAAAGGSPVAGDFFRALLSCVGMLFSFLPQLAVLYFALFLLEESGWMSALAFMTDGLFRRVGLTGRAVFSLLLGFGCTAAAILTTRGLENKKLQRRVILILPYISCSAKLPVWLAIAGSFFGGSFLYVLAMYVLGVALSFAAALLMRRAAAKEEFVLELAPLQRPSLRLACRSLLFSLTQFIIKVVTVVAGFFLAVWVLLSFSFSFVYVGAGSGQGMLAVLSRGLRYLFYPMGIADWRIALAAFSGFVAKENVAGMLALLYGDAFATAMSLPSAAAFSVLMLACSPCVSAIAATARELGAPRALLYAAVQTGVAFLLAYAVYALFAAGTLALALLFVAGACAVARKEIVHAKIYRRAAHVPARLHRSDVSAGIVRASAPAARAGGARERRQNGRKRSACRGRRGRLLHHRRGGGAPVLQGGLPRRKRAHRR